MEKCFSIALALWMFLLIGYLQSNPVYLKKAKSHSLMDLDDLGFDLLNSVSCNNEIFTSPTNVEGKCLTAALELFIDELEHATMKCDTVHHIRQTQEVLTLHSFQQTGCNFTMTVHKKFADFVEATKTFVQQFNDYQQFQEQ